MISDDPHKSSCRSRTRCSFSVRKKRSARYIVNSRSLKSSWPRCPRQLTTAPSEELAQISIELLQHLLPNRHIFECRAEDHLVVVRQCPIRAVISATQQTRATPKARLSWLRMPLYHWSELRSFHAMLQGPEAARRRGKSSNGSMTSSNARVDHLPHSKYFVPYFGRQALPHSNLRRPWCSR